MSLEFFIAKRYLKSKTKKTFLSLISILSMAGIAVGVMALVIVISVMSGALDELKDKILGVESHILLFKYDRKFDSYNKIIENTKTIENIRSSSPFIFSTVLVKSKYGVSGALLRGIDPVTTEAVKEPAKKLNMDKNNPGIIVGKDMASYLGVRENDYIYLISPKSKLSPSGQIPYMKKFIIKDIFSTDMSEYDSQIIYINLKDAQSFLKMGHNVTGIGFWLNDIYQARETSKEILNAIDNSSFHTKDWMQMNKNFFSALKLEKAAMFIALVLIVLVAAFNIASSLIMLVMEKKKDIAILKAMGASDTFIRKIFVYQGMLLGFIGTLIGIVTGVIACFIIKKYEIIKLPDAYPFTRIPVNLELLDVIVIAAVSLIICFVSTLYPAKKASGLNPVDAIRYS